MKTVTVRIGSRGRPGANGSSAWADITGKPSTFPPSSHTHVIADTTGLQSALDGKAPTSHTHVIGDVTGLQTALDGKASTSHTHAQSDVTGLTSALAAKADLVDGMVPTAQIPAIAITEFLGSVANEAAMLALTGQRGDWCNRSDVSKAFVLIAEPASTLGNWAAIDYPASPVLSVNGQTGTIVLGKSDVGLGNVPNTDATSRANHTGTQAISTVTGLQSALDGKAPTGHTHVIGDVTGLQTALDGKAPTSHTHVIGDVTGLQDALDGKAPTGHTHAFSSITGNPSDNTKLAAVIGFNVKEYGATGNARKVTDAVLNGTTTHTSATAVFTNADVGKVVWGVEVGSGILRLPKTTITAVNSATSITTAGASTGSYSGIHLVLGTDDTTALQAAMTAAKAAGANVIVPAGGYLFSALPFDANRTTVGEASGVIGAGSNVTIFYPVPSFDFASTTSNTGIFYRTNGNCRNSMLCGLQIEGSYHSYSGASGYHLLSDSGYRTLFDDLKVRHAKGFTAMANLTGTRFNAVRCFFEGASYVGLSLSGGSYHFEDCYTGRHAYFGLHIMSINGAANYSTALKWIGGIIDESDGAGGAASYITNSTDVVFIGARFFGPTSNYSCEIASSSHARFVGCELIGYGASGNRGGLKVASGCIATLSSCRLHGLGTLYGLDNSGTVYDGGGNVSNNKTGAGTISIPTL